MKCVVCDKEATGRISPDMDLQGVGYCDQHQDGVMLAYIALIGDGIETFERMIQKLKKKSTDN